MNPAYARAHFLLSAPSASHAPPDAGAEVAFSGRSNAGKSSALNAIVQQRALARTSKTPGRTQLINFFALDEGRRLVDLPGYGYARVPEAVKRHWQQMMEGYLSTRRSLRGVILVMDVRHPLTPFDEQMLGWCQHRQMPVHVLLTKADKLKRGAAQSTLLAVRRALPKTGALSVQLFSATKNLGVAEAQQVLDEWLDYAPPGAEHESDGQKKAPA